MNKIEAFNGPLLRRMYQLRLNGSFGRITTTEILRCNNGNLSMSSRGRIIGKESWLHLETSK